MNELFDVISLLRDSVLFFSEDDQTFEFVFVDFYGVCLMNTQTADLDYFLFDDILKNFEW